MANVGEMILRGNGFPQTGKKKKKRTGIFAWGFPNMCEEKNYLEELLFYCCDKLLPRQFIESFNWA